MVYMRKTELRSYLYQLNGESKDASFQDLSVWMTKKLGFPITPSGVRDMIARCIADSKTEGLFTYVTLFSFFNLAFRLARIQKDIDFTFKFGPEGIVRLFYNLKPHRTWWATQ